MPEWFQGIVNTIGAGVEMLWPGNWVGLPIVQEAKDQRAPIPKTGDPTKDRYPWFDYKKAAQTTAPLTNENVDVADVIPVIVGALVTVYLVWRK